MINEDELSKINAIFKSGDITLALMLIESQGFDLKDVLYQLYYTYREGDENQWSLDSIEYDTANNIALRDHDEKYLLWLGNEKGIITRTIDKAIDKIIEFIQQFK